MKTAIEIARDLGETIDRDVAPAGVKVAVIVIYEGQVGWVTSTTNTELSHALSTIIEKIRS